MTQSFDYGIHYREFNADTDEYAEKMAKHVHSLLNKWLPQEKNIATLDIGCGMGFTMLALRHNGYKSVHGVDIDKSQIESCRRKNLHVELIQDLAVYLENNKSKFNLITMIDVIEHIPHNNQLEILKLINEALTPDGRLIIQAPNANSIIASRWLYIDFTHHISYTEHSIKFALRSAGFGNVVVPFEDNTEPRPSIRPMKIFTKSNRTQFKRWIIRRLWRQVMIVEMGEDQGKKIPLGVNLYAIADK